MVYSESSNGDKHMNGDKMEYFLVKGTVRKILYMGTDTSFQDIRLVKADSPDQAERKFQNYWEDKTSEYSVYYHACGEAQETIS
jgi:hypothetical protein